MSYSFPVMGRCRVTVTISVNKLLLHRTFEANPLVNREAMLGRARDGRPFPEPHAKVALTPDGPLHVVSRHLTGSKDFRAAEHVLAYEFNRRLR